MTDDRYLIISADCHAGLPCEEYRPYLDAQVPRAVRRLRRRAARASATSGWPTAASTSTHWETRTPKVCAARSIPPSATRSSTATASRARCCSPTPTRSPAARRRRSARGSRPPTSPIPSSRSPGARAHNRFLAELCSHSPERRAGVALVPITHDVDRAVAEIEWAAANGLRGGILVPTMWRDHTPYLDPMLRAGVGRVRGARHAGAHALRVRAAGRVPGERRRLPRRGRVVGRAADVVPPVRRRVRTASEPEVLRHRVGRVLGARSHVEVGHVPRRRPHDEEDGRPARGQGVRGCRASTSARNIFIGASTMSREEIRRRYAIGTDTVMWGNDYPASRRHVAAHRRQAARNLPRRPGRGLRRSCSAGPRRACTASTSTRSRRSRSASGPTPADLGQDPSRAVDPEEVKQGRWWKEGLVPPGTV